MYAEAFIASACGRVMMKIKKKYQPYMYFIPAFLFMGIFLIYPLFSQFIIAFQHYQPFKSMEIYFSFVNFKKMLTDEVLWLSIKNTLIWVGFSLLFQFPLGLGVAFLLNKKIKGRSFFRTIFVVPWAISPFLIGLIFAWLYHGRVGIINDVLLKLSLIKEPIAFLADKNIALASIIVANIWFGIPFFAVILLAAMQSIPDEVYEAASMDGANQVDKFFGITVPMIKPAMVNTLLLRTIWIFNFGEIIYVMTGGGPAHHTEILSTYIMYVAYYESNYGYAAAIAVMISIFLLGYSIFMLRLLRSGEKHG